MHTALAGMQEIPRAGGVCGHDQARRLFGGDVRGRDFRRGRDTLGLQAIAVGFVSELMPVRTSWSGRSYRVILRRLKSTQITY